MRVELNWAVLKWSLWVREILPWRLMFEYKIQVAIDTNQILLDKEPVASCKLTRKDLLSLIAS